MAIVHVFPVPCIFESEIQQRADALGHECFRYRIHRSLRRNIAELWRFYRRYGQYRNHLFLFHCVSHIRVFLLSILLRQFSYCLIYWGGDYYSTFLDENTFEQHCLKKSTLLRAEYYEQTRRRTCQKWKMSLWRHVGFRVLGRATAVLSLSPKQFRIARYLYFRAMRRPLCTPHFPVRGYAPDLDRSSPHPRKRKGEELRVLICHSATPSVAPHQSLQIVKEYKRLWGATVHICGFLSYSGRDENYRTSLEEELIRAAAFADTIGFERKFLQPEDLSAELNRVDLAVFSCLRDEGLGLLTQLVNMGGLVSFNKFSMNYDFFKNYSPGKSLTHEQFLGTSPTEIIRRRTLSPEPPGRMMFYDQLAELLHSPRRSSSAPAGRGVTN
jgi:hypothetical protein